MEDMSIMPNWYWRIIQNSIKMKRKKVSEDAAKKRIKKRWIILGAVLLIVVATAIYLLMPVTFVDFPASEVTKLEIFNGNNGETVVLTDGYHVYEDEEGQIIVVPDQEVIQRIVDEFYGVQFKRTGTRFGMGTSFWFTFNDDEDTTFILMSEVQASRGRFFYDPVDGREFSAFIPLSVGNHRLVGRS